MKIGDDTNIDVVYGLFVNGTKLIESSRFISSYHGAATVTITAGTTKTTWTHNFGIDTNYALILSPNTDARHVYWANKTANSVDICIDDAYDSDILVDVVLIGF